MREGCWINAKTGQFFWIDEHATWMKNELNAHSIGLPKKVYEKIMGMNWDFNGPGRAEILATVMNAGFIRMRGHGSFWTFEFTIKSSDALWSCLEFLDNFAGPMTQCRFNNLRTGEAIEVPYTKFKQEMAEDPEKLLRVAKVMTEEAYPTARRIAFRCPLFHTPVAQRQSEAL